jgi:PAS domain S-box-containing protein
VEFNAKWVRLERDYIVTVVRDISRRQEAEQALRASEARFRQLAENIDEVFWITDPTQSRVLYVSPAYERVWGRTCESLYAAPPTWRDAIHPQDRARVILATGERQALGTYREEYRILRPDGSERWVRDRAFPVRDADGALQRIVGIAEDITEQRKIQERFLRAQRMEAIGTLASGIAHDLNNILGPLLMVPALLREYAKSDRERQLLDVVARGAQRSSEIVRQLLTFSRGSGGERVSVQFRPLFKEMTAFMKATFPGNIIVEQRAARDLRPVLGDPTQLQQVLMNLCVNARDAMPHGGKLSLAAKNVELSEAGAREHPPAKPGPYVTVTITDTGEGIDPEIVGRIFEPFFTTKPANKGTGLGLSTAQGIVRSHQGFISVVSKPGLGTSFTLYIPAAAVVSEPVAAPATDAPPRGQGELILVVDDEASLVTTTRLILEWNGYRVVTASNGGAAIAVFLEHREKVRVVLTDVSMPVRGGGGFDTGPAGPGPQGQGARHHRAGRRQHSKRTAGGRRQRISAKTVRPARTA